MRYNILVQNFRSVLVSHIHFPQVLYLYKGWFTSKQFTTQAFFFLVENKRETDKSKLSNTEFTLPNFPFLPVFSPATYHQKCPWELQEEIVSIKTEPQNLQNVRHNGSWTIDPIQILIQPIKNTNKLLTDFGYPLQRYTNFLNQLYVYIEQRTLL